MTENEIATQIVDAIVKIHRQLGPGLLETIYEGILEAELRKRGLNVQRQHPMPIYYEGERLEAGYRADLLVEGKVIVEIKPVEELEKVHFKQVLTYLRLSDLRLGILVNFNVDLVKHGIRRIANEAVDGVEPKASKPLSVP